MSRPKQVIRQLAFQRAHLGYFPHWGPVPVASHLSLGASAHMPSLQWTQCDVPGRSNDKENGEKEGFNHRMNVV